MIRLRRKSRVAGFTLIEVLVTLALMGIVLPVAMRAITIAISASSYARHAAEASMLGQSKLNELVEMVKIDSANTPASSGDFGAQWPAYSWAFEEVIDSELSISRVSLIVSWIERGQPRELRLSTMYFVPTT